MLSCSAAASDARFDVAGEGIVRALWWNDGWLLATDTQVGKFAPDGTVLIPFTKFSGPSPDTSSFDPYVAITADTVIIAYSEQGSSGGWGYPHLVVLDSHLAVKTGPVDIGSKGSKAAGLSPDGRAVSWYQGYYATSEGYRFSLLASDLTLAGTTDVFDSDFVSTESGEITAGANGFFVFYRKGCPSLQRYDTAGSRIGASVVLKPADQKCPDDTNIYASRSLAPAAYASGAHLVAFGDIGSNTQPWLGYAVVDDASGVPRAVASFPKPKSGTVVSHPTVAAYGGRFAVAWPTKPNDTSTTRTANLAIIGTDGAQLSAVTSLGQTLTSSLGPIVAASPAGFVVFINPGSTSAKGYTTLNISCN